MPKPIQGVPIAVALAIGVVVTLAGFLTRNKPLLAMGLVVIGVGVVIGIVAVTVRGDGKASGFPRPRG
jgi:hypothetical protein